MVNAYPANGRKIIIDFGTEGPFDLRAEIEFDANGESLSFLVTRGPLEGKVETCQCVCSEVAPDIWMVSWQEIDQLTVTQTHNFATGRLWGTVTQSDLQFVRTEGTLELV